MDRDDSDSLVLEEFRSFAAARDKVEEAESINDQSLTVDMQSAIFEAISAVIAATMLAEVVAVQEANTKAASIVGEVTTKSCYVDVKW